MRCVFQDYLRRRNVAGAKWTVDIGPGSSVVELLTRVAVPDPGIYFHCVYIIISLLLYFIYVRTNYIQHLVFYFFHRTSSIFIFSSIISFYYEKCMIK